MRLHGSRTYPDGAEPENALTWIIPSGSADMATMMKQQIREMTADEARAFLGERHTGRIAFVFREHVDIEPIHYATHGDWLFGRTSPGTKLSSLLHHPWCAFEVDDVRGVFHWSSVVVKGTFQLLDPETSRDRYDRALRLLREVVPGTLTADDPVPRRTLVFGIYMHELSGREMRG